MKVAFISDHLLGGGKERRLVEIICGLVSRNRIEPVLILWDGKSAENSVAYKACLNLAIPIYYLGSGSRRENIFKTYCILKDERVEAINTWAPAIYSIYILYSQVRLRIPVYNSSITGARDGYSRKEKIVMHCIHLTSKLVNSNCERAMEVFHIPTKKRKVIYNGFDFQRVAHLKSVNETRKEFHVTTRYLISMAGRYDKAKDWPTHVKAANMILDKGYDVTFLCMGSGDADGYEALIVPAYRDRIRFIGRQTDVESIFAASDIVTLSTFGEGISNSILEGMAVSKPIVATEGGGTPEIVEDGRSGFITRMCDADDYAKRIIQLLDDEQLRRAMGERGLEIVQTKFNIHQMIDGFENMLLYGK